MFSIVFSYLGKRETEGKPLYYLYHLARLNIKKINKSSIFIKDNTKYWIKNDS